MPFPILILYLLFITIVFPFRLIPEDSLEPINDLLIALFCFGGSWFFWRVSVKYSSDDKTHIVWRLFAIGVGLEGVGHAVYFLSEMILGASLSFPHPGDYLIIAGEICAVCAMALFYKQLNESAFFERKSHKILANIILLLFMIAMWIWVIQPVLGSQEDPLWLRIAYQIYPVIGIVMAYFSLHLSLALLDMGSARVARPWQILSSAYFLFVLTDSWYGYLETHGAYAPYSWVIPGWGLAYCLIAYAAYRQYRLMKSF